MAELSRRAIVSACCRSFALAAFIGSGALAPAFTDVWMFSGGLALAGVAARRVDPDRLLVRRVRTLSDRRKAALEALIS